MTEVEHPAPMLLCNPDYYGTLAATRLLGRRGIPVSVAGEQRLAVSSWSRYATRRLRCPASRDSSAFVDWLLAFGKREPGHTLCPTSDDLTYLYALHREELSQNF